MGCGLEASKAETRNFCSKVSRGYEKKLTQRFKQNPKLFLEHLLEESKKSMSDADSRNKLIAASFDLRKVYIANAKSFNSKLITNNLFDWIKLQFFGNLNKNYIEKSDLVRSKSIDLFSPQEKLNMEKLKPLWTSVEQASCSKQESILLGCKGSVYKMKLQFLPEVSCKDRDLKRAFESEFILTYSPKYGFKILDVKLSGKRIVFDSVEMMTELKKSGFNKNAIADQLALLSHGDRSFRIPRKRIHSGRFLANYRLRSQQKDQKNQDRMPASL